MRILILAGVLALHISSFAATPEPMMVDEALNKQLLLVAVRPDRPHSGWRAILGTRPMRSGVFDLRFDYETGHLREIHMVESTGFRLYDAHVIGALKLWKAKPHSIHTLRVPITFR